MNTYMYLFVFTVLAAGPKYVRAPHQGSIRVSTALKCSSNSKHVRMFLGPNVPVNNNVIYWHARQIISSIFFSLEAFSISFLLTLFPRNVMTVRFLSLLCTVWNFQDFCVTQILREMKFWNSRSQKYVVFAILGALDCYNLDNSRL